MRVARDQVNSSQGKSLMPAMNDVKMEQHGKREVNDILYKKKWTLDKGQTWNFHLRRTRISEARAIQTYRKKARSDQWIRLTIQCSKAGASLWPLAAQCDCEQQIFYYYCCPKFKSSALQLENGKLVTPAKKAFHFCHVLFFTWTLFEISRVPMILLEKLG